MRIRRGFTLIELLVVIAIIAILAAILFPVFSRARAKARQAACGSNQKQVVLAVGMYIGDYDELYPLCEMWGDFRDFDSGKWYDVVGPYVRNKELFVCPDRKTVTRGRGYGWNIGGSTGANGFGYRAANPMTYSGRVISLGEVSYPAETILIGCPGTSSWQGYAITGFRPDWLPNQHNGGANYGFADGHVKWLQLYSTNQLKVDTRFDVYRP